MAIIQAPLLNLLRESLQARSAHLTEDTFLITSLAKISAHFRPNPYDFPYSDTIIVANAAGPGSCYCYLEDPVIPANILGKDARYTQSENLFIDIAILDAAYAALRPRADLVCRLEGSSLQKSATRATLIASEVQRLIQLLGVDPARITMVGAVGNVLQTLVRDGAQVYATDLDSSLIGKQVGGVLVEDGHIKTLDLVSSSDVAVVTGMTLATQTLADILEVAQQNRVKVVMFAQTGGNFAGEYLRLGVDSIVSEEYPFYMFPGSTALRVFRRAS